MSRSLNEIKFYFNQTHYRNFILFAQAFEKGVCLDLILIHVRNLRHDKKKNSLKFFHLNEFIIFAIH